MISNISSPQRRISSKEFSRSVTAKSRRLLIRRKILREISRRRYPKNRSFTKLLKTRN